MTTLLCACRTADNPSSEISDTSHMVGIETDESLFTDTATGDTGDVSSVRYIREYEIEELAEAGSYWSNIYMRDDKLYLLSTETEGAYRKLKLTVYDETGASETIYLPEIQNLSEYVADKSERSTMMPAYAYALSDERWLTVWQGLNGYIFITDKDGAVICHSQLPKEVRNLFSVNIDEDENGLHILFNTTSTLYYFDDTLTLQQTIFDNYRSPGLRTPLSLGNGVYQYGYFANRLTLLDTKDGTMTPTTLRLPNSHNQDWIVSSGNGEIYHSDDIGIMRYREGDPSETILKWSECGYYFGGNDVCYVLDDSAVFVVRETEHLGQLKKMLSLFRIKTRERTAEDKQVITLVSYNYSIGPWLTSAVYQFNRTNDQYQVNLVSGDRSSNGGLGSYIDQALMSNGVDMLIPWDVSDLSPHYDKNIFVDLNTYFGDRVLGCIGNLYGRDGAMFVLPTSFSFTTLTAKKSLLNGAEMTWDTVYKIRDALPDNALFAVSEMERAGHFSKKPDGTMYSTASYVNLPKRLYEYTAEDYADWTAGETQYDTDAYRDMIVFLQWMTDNKDESIGGYSASSYGAKIANNTFVRRLREDGIAFLETSVSSIEHLSILQRLYGEDAYTLCGYPSETGGFIRVKEVQNPIAVLETSEYQDGCIAFLEFLLSDELQNADGNLLPVTKSALRAQLEDNRWFYYLKSQIKTIETPKKDLTDLDLPGTYSEYVSDYGITGDTESMYDVFSMTDENIEEIKEFFDTIDIRAKADNTILEIINEELSYWQNNARSLEETTKIIDSRVWIYLNE